LERAQHAQFVHRAVIDDAQDHLDFVLSLKPGLVYALKQLWSALREQPLRVLEAALRHREVRQERHDPAERRRVAKTNRSMR
jgi:hypothetical protein